MHQPLCTFSRVICNLHGKADGPLLGAKLDLIGAAGRMSRDGQRSKNKKKGNNAGFHHAPRTASSQAISWTAIRPRLPSAMRSTTASPGAISARPAARSTST